MYEAVNQAYQPRIVDGQLDRLLDGLPAVCVGGAAGCGQDLDRLAAGPHRP